MYIYAVGYYLDDGKDPFNASFISIKNNMPSVIITLSLNLFVYFSVILGNNFNIKRIL
jgi:hypothetical protein